MTAPLPLLSVPNVSEGRDAAALDTIGAAFTSTGATLLNRHEDADHHRAVYTLTAPPGQLAQALLAGAKEAINQIDLNTPRGAHPHVGAIDVLPLVYYDPALRGAACAEALVTADLLAHHLDLPVFLYGILASGRTRAELRRGGTAALAQCVAEHELKPDFGPTRPHPTAGFALVGARPPLIAFNLELKQPATLDQAQRIAQIIRAHIPGVKAIAVDLQTQNAIQVSTNVEDARPGVLAEVITAVQAHHAVQRAELVGLTPRRALDNFPPDLDFGRFDPARDILENALGL